MNDSTFGRFFDGAFEVRLIKPTGSTEYWMFAGKPGSLDFIASVLQSNHECLVESTIDFFNNYQTFPFGKGKSIEDASKALDRKLEQLTWIKHTLPDFNEVLRELEVEFEQHGLPDYPTLAEIEAESGNYPALQKLRNLPLVV